MANLVKDGGDETAAQEESTKAKTPSTESKARETSSGAPLTETPESPAAPPVQMKGDATPLETPEAASPPPVEGILFGDVQSGGIRSSGVSTYVNANLASDPATQTAIDTGVGSAPYDRPSTFGPLGTTKTTPAPSFASDGGTGSQMANRAHVFDPPQTMQVFIDPGAF